MWHLQQFCGAGEGFGLERTSGDQESGHVSYNISPFGQHGISQSLGKTTARRTSFHFLILTFARKQVVGRVWAPCTAGFNIYEEKSHPQLAYDITGCCKKVINPVCSIREISNHGKNKGSGSVNGSHTGKIGKKKGYHRYKTTQDRFI